MKDNNFECSPLKHQVRQDICNQIIQGCRLTHMDSLGIGTLPGRFWHFESRLHALADANNIKLTLEAYELDRDVCEAGNPYSAPNDFTEFNGHLFSYNNAPFVFGGEDWTYDVVWADYCGTPQTERLNDFIGWANSRKEWGIGYITFSLSTRANNSEKIPTHIKSFGTNYSAKANAIIKHLTDRINVSCRVIFSDVYNHEGSPNRMVTFGIELFPTRHTKALIKPILRERVTKSVQASAFVDIDLAKTVYFLRHCKGVAAKEVAQLLGVTSEKIGGVRVSLPYKQIAKLNESRKITKPEDILVP